LTTTNAAATYQPIGTYLTSSSLNGYVTTGTTLLTNYFTKTNLGSNLTTQSINVGSGGALQIYDVGTINLQAGTITSTNGMIQHSTELDFIISSNYSSPPTSSYILQLTSSSVKVNATLTASTVSIYTLTGTSNPGVIQHSYGLIFAISSSNPVSAASDKLMTLDKTSGLTVNTSAYVNNNLGVGGITNLGSTMTCIGAATFNDLINVSGTINGSNAILSSNVVSYASPSGTGGITSYGLYTKNPNSIHSNSSASLGFYTDTTNGSNSALFLTGTDNTGSNGRTGQIYMQQPTGLIVSVPTGVG
jgi:hypothetical protein